MSTKPSDALHAGSLRDAASQTTPRTLAELLTQLGIARWDVLAFVDGSGSRRGKPGGFAAVYRDQQSFWRVIRGGMSSTTSQEAELRAVFELVNELLASKKNERSGGLLVQVITDSKYVEQKLLNFDPLSVLDTGKHTMLVGGLLEAARRGVKVVPHHILRNQNPLAELADRLSKVGRMSMISLEEKLLAATLQECESQFDLRLISRRKDKL